MTRYGERELDAVATTLNARPRKTLEWRTPAEALHALLSPSQKNWCCDDFLNPSATPLCTQLFSTQAAHVSAQALLLPVQAVLAAPSLSNATDRVDRRRGRAACLLRTLGILASGSGRSISRGVGRQAPCPADEGNCVRVSCVSTSGSGQFGSRDFRVHACGQSLKTS